MDISSPLIQFVWVTGQVPPIRTLRRPGVAVAGVSCLVALAWSGCEFERTGLGPAVVPLVRPGCGRVADPDAQPGPRRRQSRGRRTAPGGDTSARRRGRRSTARRPPVSADAAVSVPPKAPGGCPVGDDLTLCLNFEQAIDDASPRQTPVIGREVDFATGPSGRAARFAEGGSIEVASEELFGPAGGTIELWVSPATLGRRMGLVDGPYRLTLLPSGSAMCVASGGYALFTNAVRAATWTSLACTFDAEGVGLWVDGQKVRETLTPSVPRAGGT